MQNIMAVINNKIRASYRFPTKCGSIYGNKRIEFSSDVRKKIENKLKNNKSITGTARIISESVVVKDL